jgi:hypothetical protein
MGIGGAALPISGLVVFGTFTSLAAKIGGCVDVRLVDICFVFFPQIWDLSWPVSLTDQSHIEYSVTISIIRKYLSDASDPLNFTALNNTPLPLLPHAACPPSNLQYMSSKARVRMAV